MFRFASPVAGSIWFTALSKGDAIETKILTNLFHVASTKSSNHAWQIFITDILDTDNDIQARMFDFFTSTCFLLLLYCCDLNTVWILIANQMVHYSSYDLNSELKVRYSSHGWNSKLIVRYSGHRVFD